VSEPEVPDEAYIAAAIADHGFAVVRSNACGMPQARVGFVQPHLGYSSDGSVMVSEARARECMAHECEQPERNDHNPPSVELSAADPGDAREARARAVAEAIAERGFIACTAEDMGFPPDPPKKLKKPRKKPTT
jgi:hypothetical protein